MPRTSAYRLLSTLQYYGFVENSGWKNSFVLGPVFLRYAGVASTRCDLKAIVHPHLEELNQMLGEAAKLTIVRNDIGEVVSVVEGGADVRLHVSEGSTAPLYCGAANKTLLAFGSSETLQKVLLSPKTQFTANTITDNDALLRALSAICSHGFAYDNAEYVDGVYAMAVPVFGPLKRICGALSVAFIGPNGTNDKVVGRLTALMKAAEAMSKSLAGEFPYHISTTPVETIRSFIRPESR